MMAIGAHALEDERVRPIAPSFLLVEMAFRAANHLVHQGQPGGQPDAARLRVTFQERAIGQAGDDDGLIWQRFGWHGSTCRKRRQVCRAFKQLSSCGFRSAGL